MITLVAFTASFVQDYYNNIHYSQFNNIYYLFSHVYHVYSQQETGSCLLSECMSHPLLNFSEMLLRLRVYYEFFRYIRKGEKQFVVADGPTSL